MVQESKVQALIKLINDGAITVDYIKNEEYKVEVNNRLTSQ